MNINKHSIEKINISKIKRLSFNRDTKSSQVSSIVRDWNNILLEAIRNDFARPPVHARNLFHHSILMYDSWAAFSPGHETYFLNKTTNGYFCPFDGVAQSQENPSTNTTRSAKNKRQLPTRISSIRHAA